MSQEINYAETTCDKILRYLQDWDRGNAFKQFYYGDPGEIPINEQPCIIVDLMATQVDVGPSGLDKVTEQIDVAIVCNKLSYMNQFDDRTVDWKKKLELLMQGNDPTTAYYDTTSILGVLRGNFYTLGNYAFNQNVKMRYGEVPRNGVDNETTGEVHAIFSIDHFQTTLSKQ